MTLNGGMGLAVAPAGLCWLGYLTVRTWKNAESSRSWRTALMAGLTAVAAALLGLLFLASPASTARPPMLTLDHSLEAVARFLGCGFGEGVEWYAAPAIGWAALAGVVFAAIGAAVGLRSVQTRPRAVGCLAVLGGGFCVALAVLYARNGVISTWYPLLAAPVLATCWVTLAGFGPRGRWERVGQFLGLASALAVVGLNIEPGIRFGSERRDAYRELEADVRAGMPPRFVAGKYPGRLWTGLRTEEAIDRLRRHRISFFRDGIPDPEVRAVRVPLSDPRPVLECLSNDPFVPGGPPPPRIAVALPTSRGPVAGARVVFHVPETVPWLSAHLCWKTADGKLDRAEAHPARRPGESAVEFWAKNQELAEVWLEPGCPMPPLTVVSIEWLVAV